MAVKTFKVDGVPYVIRNFVNMNKTAFAKFVKDVKEFVEKNPKGVKNSKRVNRHQMKISRIGDSDKVYDAIQKEIKVRAEAAKEQA